MRQQNQERFSMPDIGRREILLASALSAALGPEIVRAGTGKGRLEASAKSFQTFKAVHEGLGSIDVSLFDFGGAAAPANFLIYDIPPGASEGVHLHNLSDPKLGPYDKFYYIIAGRGRMTIDGEAMMVGPGDHVHAPLDCWRGIENIDAKEQLKIFLTYIDRTPKA
jgi:hypothetical protein